MVYNGEISTFVQLVSVIKRNVFLPESSRPRTTAIRLCPSAEMANVYSWPAEVSIPWVIRPAVVK